jgi:hypothetical protein
MTTTTWIWMKRTLPIASRLSRKWLDWKLKARSSSTY